MNWNTLLTYGDSQQNAFETLCNQLFERFLKRNYSNDLIKFRVINGAGGDGGIEAYGELISGDIIAVQAKWFRQSIGASEIGQIRNSILTAKKLRTQIKEYIICIPHNVNSLKIGRGNKPAINHEENKINSLVDEIYNTHPDLKLTWWFDNEILTELQQQNNEGVQKYWFDKEIIFLDYLQKQFRIQKRGWLNERYIPELHGQGLIHQEYEKLCFSHNYRLELLNFAKNVLGDLQFCISQIKKFIPSNHQLPELNPELETAKENLKCFFKEFQILGKEIIAGNDLYKSQKISEVKLWDIKLKLEKLRPDNIQKNILPKLIESLDNIHKYDLPQYIEHIGLSFNQTIRLILGEPGTGKTHGLANCVEKHLQRNSPALIIQVKGSPSKNWTEILSKALELNNWRKDEILSALETLAKRNDVQKVATLKAGEEPNFESTKAIVCIDGLEEDIENESEWYARIRECLEFADDYPNVRFIFSARRYFYNNQEVPQRSVFEDVFLPREGDIPIGEIAEKYFSKEHYNIQLSSFLLIKGLDSLFSLRLFCERYKNSILTERDSIITATRELLNYKIEKAEKEFKENIKPKKLSESRNPVLDSLEIIANHFYSNVQVEHNQLVELITPTVQNYLDGSEIDSLIDYLAMNGFLIRSELIGEDGFLKKKKYLYNVTYQSIIEHVISEKIYHEIKNGSLNKIPSILHKGMIQPLDFSPKQPVSPFEKMPNQKIIQNIVNDLFIETGKLIGENNFVADGFSREEISEMQMEALRIAPIELAKKYKDKVDAMFFGGYRKQYRILKNLILPSSYSNENFYGAEYLHQILIIQPSAFERDKLWSGLDNYEKRNFEAEERMHYEYENISTAFDEMGIGKLFLSEFQLHNELPLVYAWGLATIDQQLRNSLRIALTDWSIKKPSEFLLLLNKIFRCNDPQIQEDLASIILGVASRIKEKDILKDLALWSIENVFNHLETHRNVIVRQGFRAIVERAFQFGLISKTDIEACRPRPMQILTLLPLERNLTMTHQGECYPIVHDLAWYVIKKSYDGFLEYPSGLKDNDCIEAQTLLNEYRKAYNDNSLFANSWGMAAGIAYIKSLGLTRTEGNWHTDATHGSKSKVFTYEEKYTWLAVHYIQGYLSDSVPVKRWSNERKFVKDYSQLTDIPNPAESVVDIETAVERFKIEEEWVVKEVLSKELETGIDINDNITNWVNEEPDFNIENWLNFDSTDFQLAEPNRKWTAIYNHTSLHDSKETVYSYFDAKACLIQKNDLAILKEIIHHNADELHFISHMEGLHSSPQTDTYCNPTDIVWMTWIEEDETAQTFYDGNADEEKKLLHTISQIVQNNIDGENYLMLPSKIIRELIGCYELLGSELKDSNEHTLAFNYKISDGSYRDNQELVLVEDDALKKALDRERYEIVWFVELFKEKNPLNENLDKDFHVQRTRKYFVWADNNQKKRLKFWDEWFSNQRDKA